MTWVQTHWWGHRSKWEAVLISGDMSKTFGCVLETIGTVASYVAHTSLYKCSITVGIVCVCVLPPITECGQSRDINEVPHSISFLKSGVAIGYQLAIRSNSRSNTPVSTDNWCDLRDIIEFLWAFQSTKWLGDSRDCSCSIYYSVFCEVIFQLMWGVLSQILYFFRLI